MSNPLQVTCGELSRRTGSVLVTETYNDRQARFVFRVPKGAGTARWMILMRQLYLFGRTSAWSIDISKHYFLLDGTMDDWRYAWRIIFQGEDLDQHDAEIAHSFRDVRVAGSQLVEVPLHGSPNRSPTAGTMGKVPIGQAAVRRG